MAEQRYQVVLAVIAEGRTVTEVAGQWKVSRQTWHGWLRRYELEGLHGLADRLHRPASCPHQMPAAVEAAVLEMRRAHPFWGPHRIVVELGGGTADSDPPAGPLNSGPSLRDLGSSPRTQGREAGENPALSRNGDAPLGPSPTTCRACKN